LDPVVRQLTLLPGEITVEIHSLAQLLPLVVAEVVVVLAILMQITVDQVVARPGQVIPELLAMLPKQTLMAQLVMVLLVILTELLVQIGVVAAVVVLEQLVLQELTQKAATVELVANTVNLPQQVLV
jgi:hypothetical protein